MHTERWPHGVQGVAQLHTAHSTQRSFLCQTDSLYTAGDTGAYDHKHAAPHRILSRGKKHPHCQPINKAKLLMGRGQLRVYDNTYRYGTVDAWVGSEAIERQMTWQEV